MARIVVLISGEGSNMQALVNACEAGEVPATTAGVVADRECAGLDEARRRAIPTSMVSPSDYEDRTAWSAALRDVVTGFEPDLVVSAGFMRILAPVFVDAFRGRLIDLHPSLLPAFPGAHAVRDALAAGVRVTGTTVHLVDEEVDHGSILLQEPVRVDPADTEATLHEKIKSVEHRLLPRACRLLLEGKLPIEAGGVLREDA